MKLLLFAAAAWLALAQPPAFAAPGDEAIVAAQQAFKSKDKIALAGLKALAAGQPLAPWVDYWELANRLPDATVDEVEAFYKRWSGTYVEDRLRNDWLLELGRRRDWSDFAADYPRFKMNDDREVTCYALLTRHLAGEDVAAAGAEAWHAQRSPDDGCNLLATTLRGARLLPDAEVWKQARLAAEFNRPVLAHAAAALIDAGDAKAVDQAFADPAKLLKARPANPEVALLALMRLAAADPDAAADELEKRWQRRLGATRSAYAWAVTGRQAVFKLLPQAIDDYRHAWRALPKKSAPDWTDDTLAYGVRAALRTPAEDKDRWADIERAIDAMSPDAGREPAWVYWKARAIQARAKPGAAGAAERGQAEQMLRTIAGGMDFYGKLATEDLGDPIALPPPPPPLLDTERGAAAANPGFQRALALVALGLRGEGVREWNFTLRGLDDRALLAAADLACRNQVWDRCINTSDRTQGEIDIAQRFPTPFRDQVVAQAKAAGVDPAYVYALIRQESRFVLDARSGAGAAGLMQLIPSTARWTARKLGIDYSSEMATDRDANLRLGTGYLKLILADFDGSQPLAAAAYNAGPNRPRRWREGGTFEPAAWTESIPFWETRDYVKKVLSNAVYYGAILDGGTPSLKARLGGPIGPPAAGQPDASELP